MRLSQLKWTVLRAVSIGLSVLLGSISAQAQQSSAPSMPGMSMGQPKTSNPEIKAFTDATMKMHRAMSAKLTGNADRDFVQGMIPHHQGAIDMARVELQYGTDPELRKLAEDIIAAQEKEIAFMRQWQQSHH
jgi:uncharacterized protein (DUF305 family)